MFRSFFASGKYFWKAYGRLTALGLWLCSGVLFLIPESVFVVSREVYGRMESFGVIGMITQTLWCFVFIECIILISCKLNGKSISSFFFSKKYVWRAHGRTGFLVMLTLLNVWLNINIGRVIGEASKILEQRDVYVIDDFWEKFKWFFYYRMGFVFSDFLTHYNARVFAIDWRQAITDIFIPRWARIIGKTKLTGISQRLQEEPYSFAKFFDSMGLQLLHSLLAVYGFGLELGEISPTVLHVRFAPWDTIPAIDFSVGIMLVIAAAVFVVGLVGAILIGREMPKIESFNRDKEAVYRDILVLTEDRKIPFDLDQLSRALSSVYASYLRYFRKVIPLDIWKSLYYNGIATIPWVVGAHWIFAKDLTLGGLPSIVYNFEQCMGGLSLFINNWRQIVDFFATKNRLKDLNEAFDSVAPPEICKKNPSYTICYDMNVSEYK